ncbi:hypothetical protein [Dactylosporangium matsuzakiense]|nr:hypothetical protein [Dactylosporangium matsuzakiense]UWZ50246.1 hypothetical protein Dmats_19085 [Dactylosporangium matsuzakiense]
MTRIDLSPPPGGPVHAAGTTLLPAVRIGRGRSAPVGLYVVDERGRARFVPAADVHRLAGYALAAVTVAAAAGVATAWSRRGRGPSIGTVHMGPGGWVSLKRSAAPPLRAPRGSRPWWARLLRARRLVAQ